MAEILRISGSETKTWRRCRRRWYMQYYRQLTWPAREPGALEEGSLTHVGLENYHTHYDLDLALDAIRSHLWTLMEPAHASTHEQLTEAASRAQNYVRGYVYWLHETGADQRYAPYADAVEEELEMELITVDGLEVHLIGKLDRRIYDRLRDQTRFMDFKTCQTFNQIIQNARRDEQFPTYELLMRENFPGERCGGGIWRMLRKVQRARDGDGDFYGEYERTYNESVLDSLLLRYQVIAGEIVEARRMLDEGFSHHSICPPFPEFSCGWQCDFRDVCDMMDDGSRYEDLLQATYEVHDPYERYRRLGREEE